MKNKGFSNEFIIEHVYNFLIKSFIIYNFNRTKPKKIGNLSQKIGRK